MFRHVVYDGPCYLDLYRNSSSPRPPVRSDGPRHPGGFHLYCTEEEGVYLTLSGKAVIRKKLLPIAAVVGVIILITAIYNISLQAPNQEVSFGIYWPAPSAYLPNYTPPNVYLSINYTGPGIRNYTYSITNESAVLVSGKVSVAHALQFTLLTLAPVPSTLKAVVSEGGRVVYQGNITLL